ncbi:MAG: HD domain-containing protein [Thermoflexales bacterium]|nr:HD domain-containing protein [Thermoflexales bacterium]
MATLPDLPTAMALLEEGHRRNPGPWMAHSINVGAAARHIAARLPGLDPERVYLLGLLHDIGRREGVTGMRHVYDGHRFLLDLGYADAARIALTHSFPVKDIGAVFGAWDCTPAEVAELSSALDAVTYTDEDRLLQLCDCLAIANGFCLLEKRLVDVVMRYGKAGFPAWVHVKWAAYFDLLHHFDRLLGHSVYDLLPGVEAITFNRSV